MATTIANLLYRAMYRFGFKPWDSGVPPPELKDLIEGPAARSPGKALDLGCMHSIPMERRDAYVAGVTRATVSGADLLLWAFYQRLNFAFNATVTREEVDRRFGGPWDVVRAWGGEEPDRFP